MTAKAKTVKCDIWIVFILLSITWVAEEEVPLHAVFHCLFQQQISNVQFCVLDREKKQKINDIKNNIKEAIEVSRRVDSINLNV